jgi:hypothetical protein
MHSVVLIVTAAVHDKAEVLSAYMGWGSPAYTVPLAATGQEPATHFGLHTWAEQAFVDILTAAGQGVMPQLLADAGYPEADFLAVMAGLTASIRGELTDHFTSVIAAQGLQLLSDDWT